MGMYNPHNPPIGFDPAGEAFRLPKIGNKMNLIWVIFDGFCLDGLQIDSF